MKQKILLGLVVLGLVVAGVYWSRLRPLPPAGPSAGHAMSADQQEKTPDVTTADASVDAGNARITLSVLPRPPVALSRKRFRVRVESKDGAPLALDGGRIAFEMTMPMGDHRYALVPGDAGWQEAEVVLPMCGSGDPRWHAIVEGTVAGRAVSARFRFELAKPGTTPTDSAASIPQGFYRGKAGDATVSVCFDAEGDRYYDESVGKTVGLVSMEKPPGSYLLSPPSHPRPPEDFDPETDSWWVLVEHAGRVTGSWHVGSKASAIAIDKVADRCDLEFEARRSGRAPVIGETIQADTVVLQRIVDPVTSVEYLRILSGIPEQAARIINGRLGLAASELGESWAECEDFEASISPRFVSRLWMAFDAEREGYCGAPGRFMESAPMVAASDTGEYIDFDRWIDDEFRADTISGRPRGRLWDSLIRAVRREWKDIDYAEIGESCAEVLERSRLLPWMDARGFNFRLQTGDSRYWTCMSDYRIPFGTMRPFIAKLVRPAVPTGSSAPPGNSPGRHRRASPSCARPSTVCARNTG